MLGPKGHLPNDPPTAVQTAYSKYYRIYRMHHLLQNSTHADGENTAEFLYKSIYEMCLNKKLERQLVHFK